MTLWKIFGLVFLASFVFTLAAAQTPAPPSNVIYMAADFCPEGSTSIHPRSTLVKLFGAFLPNPLPGPIKEAEQEGRFLLPCQLNRSAGTGRERYLSEVFVVGPGAACPSGSVAADGRTIRISDGQALFSLLGTNYGGDGRQTFAIPELAQKSAGRPGAPVFCISLRGPFPSR